MRSRNVFFVPNISQKLSTTRHRRGLGVRHLQCFLLFLCIALSTLSSGSVNIALTKMKKLEEFHEWGNMETLDIFNFYFFTYILAKIFGGYIGTKMNNKCLLVFYGFSSTILQYSSPAIIKNFGLNGFRGVRFLLGIVQGISLPLVFNQISRWVPQNELILLVPTTLSGYFFGYSNILAFGPDLVYSENSWSTIFYFTGNCGLIWTLAFLGLGAQGPETCYLISALERNYIESNQGFSVKGSFRRRIPLRAILKNINTYSLFFCYIAYYYGQYSSVTMVPKMIIDVGFTNSGIFSGIPYFASVFFTFLITILADYLVQSNKITIRKLRFISNSIAFYGKASAFFFFADANTTTSKIIWHSISVILESFSFLGFQSAIFDVAPNFAGFFHAIVAGPSNLGILLGLYSFSLLEESDDWDIAWRGTLNFSAMAYILSNLFFVGFANFEIQTFNFFVDESDEEDI